MIYIQMFIAGLLNYISPCILPVMPILIGYLIGEGKSKRRNKIKKEEQEKENLEEDEIIRIIRKYANIYLFITGFIITFVVLGILASSLRNYYREIHAIFKYCIWCFSYTNGS